MHEEHSASSSMKLFISYGHPEHEICRRIMQHLTDQGFDTWFDEDRLHAGVDWREEIVRGISSSNGVIACLSKHAGRSISVCLSELSIAVSLKDGNIVSVLLEKEDDTFHVPAMINHIQWLDMTAWQEEKQKGADAFESWFQQKMGDLVRILKSRGTQEFEGQLSLLKKKLRFYPSNERRNTLLSAPFVGREWLTDQISTWLDDPNGEKFCIVTGDPGVGKSAFAAHFVTFNARVAASIFCAFNEDHLNSPRTVIQTLAYLLACRLKDYRQYLVLRLEALDQLDRFNEQELFRLLLGETMRSVIDGQRDTMCIVIDGLDECGTPERNALADTLTRYADMLPRWLRVLITTRDVGVVTEQMPLHRHLELRGHDRQNQADVRLYFEQQLKADFSAHPQWKTAIDTLTARSGGIFLYAKLMAEAVLQGRMSLDDPDAIPDGLNAAFHRWFQWMFTDGATYRAHYRKAMGCILAAPSPLPQEELEPLMGWDHDDRADFLARIRILLRPAENALGKPVAVFSHKYIADWLDDPANTVFHCDQSSAVKRMAERFHAIYREDRDSLTDYEAMYLVRLLKDAGLKHAWQEAAADTALCERLRLLGDDLRARGQLDAAREVYELAFEGVNDARAWSDDPDVLRMTARCIQARIFICIDQGMLPRMNELTESALDLCETLMQRRGNHDDKYALSNSYWFAGRAAEISGEPANALIWFRESLYMDENLFEERGALLDQRALATSCSKMGDLMERQSDLDAALTWYRKSHSLHEDLVQKRGNADDRGRLSNSCRDIGDIYRARGDLSGAMAWYEKCLKLRRVIVDEERTPKRLAALSGIYSIMGDMARSHGKLDEGLSWYEKALTLDEAVVRERGTAGDRASLATSYEQIGDIALQRGDHNAALIWYHKSLTICQQLMEQRGSIADRRDLSIVYDKLGRIAKLQSDMTAARSWYEKSLEIAESVVRDRGSASDRSDLASSYIDMGDLASAADRDAESHTWYEKARVICEQLASEHPTLSRRHILMIVYERLSNAAYYLGEYRTAQGWQEKSLAMNEAICRERGTIDDRRGVAVSYEKLGQIASALHHRDEALIWHGKSLEISKAILRERGAAEDYRDCAVSLLYITRTHKRQLRERTALACLQEAREYCLQLIQMSDTQRNRNLLHTILEEMDALNFMD